MKILKKYQKGFTLIEILLTVGLATIAAIGGYYIYDKISYQNTINKEIEDINRIIVDLKPVLLQKNKLDINANFLASYGILDKNKVIDNSYKNFLASQTIFGYLFDNKTNEITHLKVQYPNMTKEYCAQLINAHESKSDFISVSAFLVKNTLNQESENYHFNKATAFETCNKASYPENNFSLIFSINLNK